LAHRLRRERVRALAGGRAYYDPGKKKTKKEKKTTTSRYTIPRRNGCPATAITSRSNCVLIRCPKYPFNAFVHIPITLLGISYSLFQRFWCALSLYYYGLFNDFLNGRKVHPECHMTLQRKKSFKKSPPEFASNPPLGEHEKISFFIF
jgi:hypothetical protein